MKLSSPYTTDRNIELSEKLIIANCNNANSFLSIKVDSCGGITKIML